MSTYKKRFVMEPFYRNMRRKHHILMDKGIPAWGKWTSTKATAAGFDWPLDFFFFFTDDTCSVLLNFED